MLYTSYCSWILALVIVFWLHPTQGYRYGYYSLCNMLSLKHTWQKNSGYQLQVWIQSVVPYPSKDPNILAGFSSDQNYISLNEIQSPSGLVWRNFGSKRLDGWLYGKLDSEGYFRTNKTLYVFPDYKSAIYGTFTKDGNFVEGFESRITHYRCKDGVMELKFSKPKDDAPLLKPFTPNSHTLSKTPLIRDPLEKRNVFLHPSINIPVLKNEDSLYARRDMPPHTLVSYYNGYFVEVEEAFTNSTDFDKTYKNSMGYSDRYIMNMPFESADTKNYVATLGHKVNHHFWNYQVLFGFSKHPLYGEIRCIVSQKHIVRGQELFAHYGYPLDNPEVPDWYKYLYKNAAEIKPEVILKI